MRRRPLALLSVLAVLAATPAYPQAVENPLTDGQMLIHGNYCGPGNRGYDVPPIDALDAACRQHDLCTPDGFGALPKCSCNRRLSRAASRIAKDPNQPEELRAMADVVAGAAQVPICRP